MKRMRPTYLRSRPLGRPIMICKTKTRACCSKLLKETIITLRFCWKVCTVNRHMIYYVWRNKSCRRKFSRAIRYETFLEMKTARIEDQVKSFSDQIHRAAEDRSQNSVSLENIQKRLSESRKSSQQAKETLEELQSNVKNDRANLFGKQIELERERLEEELEAVKRKAECLKAQKASSVAGKLQKELQEYKEILKCSVCVDRPKEVVITKCYHLLCNPCVQKVLETRHRKCPVCAASFGPNDVKHVYI